MYNKSESSKVDIENSILVNNNFKYNSHINNILKYNIKFIKLKVLKKLNFKLYQVN